MNMNFRHSVSQISFQCLQPQRLPLVRLSNEQFVAPTREKEGIKAILELLTEDDIKSLVITLTKGQISVSSAKEREEAVFAFTQDSNEFLHRRVCSKNVLVQYAFKESLAVSSKFSKEDVIHQIRTHWSKTSHGTIKRKSPVSTPTPNFDGLTTPPNPTNQPSPFSPCHITVNNITNISNDFSNHNSSCNIKHTYIHNQIHTTSPHHHQTTTATTSESDLVKQFGEQFAHWFYDTLNNIDPQSLGFSPANFLPNVALRSLHVTPTGNEEEVVEGSQCVTDFLLKFFRQFKLHPNYSTGGLKTLFDPHGLRMVLVCGTVFSHSSFVGVFEQSFGLVQDTQHKENWKIQVTEMRLRRASDQSMPSLRDFDDVAEIEACTKNALEIILRPGN